MEFEWILFDADHTLYDFERSAEVVLEKTMRAHGMDMTNHHYPSYARINRRQWAAYENGDIDRATLMNSRFNLYFEYIGVEPSDISSFNKDYLRELPLHPFLIDGAERLIEEATGRFKTGIITNGAKEVQRPRLVRSGYHDRFDVIVVSGEIDLAKPDPAYFEYAYEKMGRPRKETVLVVGDSLNSDIRGGAGFGFKTCWYNPDRNTNDSGVRPDFEVTSIHQIRSLLGIT